MTAAPAGTAATSRKSRTVPGHGGLPVLDPLPDHVRPKGPESRYLNQVRQSRREPRR
jgi:hypothetical protein